MSHDCFLSDIIGERRLHGRCSWLLDERQLVNRSVRYNHVEDYICIEAQEIMWAVIVYYEAFDVADWMISRGYNATPEWFNSSDDGMLCVPYDAAKWDQWLRSCMMLPPSPSLHDNHIKNAVAEMVSEGYIKIPLNHSGCPMYHWLLEGYT